MATTSVSAIQQSSIFNMKNRNSDSIEVPVVSNNHDEDLSKYEIKTPSIKLLTSNHIEAEKSYRQEISKISLEFLVKYFSLRFIQIEDDKSKGKGYIEENFNPKNLRLYQDILNTSAKTLASLASDYSGSDGYNDVLTGRFYLAQHAKRLVKSIIEEGICSDINKDCEEKRKKFAGKVFELTHEKLYNDNDELVSKKLPRKTSKNISYIEEQKELRLHAINQKRFARNFFFKLDNTNLLLYRSFIYRACDDLANRVESIILRPANDSKNNTSR